MAARLIEACDGLQDLPERGRRGKGGVRELAMIAPYVIRYRADGEQVYILGIRHGAQRAT